MSSGSTSSKSASTTLSSFCDEAASPVSVSALSLPLAASCWAAFYIASPSFMDAVATASAFSRSERSSS